MLIHALRADHPDYCVNLGGIALLLVDLVAEDQSSAGNAHNAQSTKRLSRLSGGTAQLGTMARA